MYNTIDMNFIPHGATFIKKIFREIMWCNWFFIYFIHLICIYQSGNCYYILSISSQHIYYVNRLKT